VTSTSRSASTTPRRKAEPKAPKRIVPRVGTGEVGMTRRSQDSAACFPAGADRGAWLVELAYVTPVSDAAGYHHMAGRRLLPKRGRLEHGPRERWRHAGVPGVHRGQCTRSLARTCGGCAGAIRARAIRRGSIVLIAGLVVSPRASLLAGILQSIWPTAVIYTPVFGFENLATPLLLAGTAVAWRGWDGSVGRRGAVARIRGGVATGLLVLVRPSNCFFRAGARRLDSGRGGSAAVRAAGSRRPFSCGTLGNWRPWVARNYQLGLGPCHAVDAGRRGPLVGQ